MSDLISRQAAIEALGDEPQVRDENDDYDVATRNQWRYDLECIKDVPTVDTDLSGYSDKLWKAAYERGKTDAVKHGEWMPENRRPKSWSFYCSECKRTAYDPQNHHSDVPKRCRYAFCPNCGARMDL